MFRAASLVVVLFLAPQVRADDPEKEKKGPPAADLLAEGLSKAKKEDKRVFLIFGSPTCGWCKYLDKYHADAEVGKVVEKYFVLVKVDVVTNPGGEEMYKKYGTDRGVPAWTVLAPDAKVLTDSGDGKDNVGFPYEEKEVEHYVKVVRLAAPKMTDSEAQLLVKKLRDIGPKKEKQEDKKDK
jgi:thiol-disulfide isomerase/thioredoxin